MDIQNGSYIQYDNKGKIYSYSEFSGGKQTYRIDFQGSPHAGYLPHIHIYRYNENMQIIAREVYNIFGERIG